MINNLKKFFKDEEGATILEYALMVAFIAVVCVGAVTLLGTNASTSFDNSATAIAS